jgi:mannan endo-1,4-beta-mannosidase
MSRWRIICVVGCLIIGLFSCKKEETNSAKNPSERIKFEAENATLKGTLIVDSIVAGYTGKGYILQFNNIDDKLIFNLVNDSAGEYNIYIAYTTSSWGKSSCNVKINNTTEGVCKFDSTGNVFKEVKCTRAKLWQGLNTLVITPSGSNFAIDYIRIEAYSIGTVSSKLVTPNPMAEAVNLYNYLKTSYGKKIHSGATAITSSLDEENWIYQQTGKYPALAGFDFMNHTRNYSWENKSLLVTNAKYWWSQNGIVVAHWHWRDPLRTTDAFYSMGTSYSERTSFDVSKLSDTLSIEYTAVIKDIDTIANYLRQLRDAKVPVLWRPLHEASGTWFWWGYHGAEATKRLWKIMFNRLVKHHGLNNLIWIWTSDIKSDDLDWYPGDDYVDILGMDIYPANGDFSSQVASYNKLKNDFEGRKLITLSENGSIPDPDNLANDKAGWLWFMPWYGDYTRSAAINPVAHWQKIMSHDYVISRDEMPNLKN